MYIYIYIHTSLGPTTSSSTTPTPTFQKFTQVTNQNENYKFTEMKNTLRFISNKENY